MSAGRLIVVVGPSGVGKDSLMAALKAARPEMRFVRRTITRTPDLGGEAYHAVSPDTFERAIRDGAFCVHWAAHGLSYGIPKDVLTDVWQGRDCLADLSRSALPEAATVFPRLLVLNITASPDTLSRRLSRRGRETETEIAARLTRTGKPLPDGLEIVTIVNDGALEDALDQARGALDPARA